MRSARDVRMNGRFTVLMFVAACGGVVLTPAPDATVDAPNDAAFAFPDVVEDSFEVVDASAPDEGCEPFETKTCDGGCPTGTVCARYLGGCPVPIGPNPIVDLGCVPIPTACGGEWSCACMGLCACGYDYCYDQASTFNRQDSGLLCQCTTSSRRAYKKDIEYIDPTQRADLANELFSASPAQRDVYGQLTAILAAAQENQTQINRLRKEIANTQVAGR